jgi:hypothetical protein
MYCNYASGQSVVEKPYSPGIPCTSCRRNLCTNNICTCNKICQNYGTLNSLTCQCVCQPYATGDYCEELVCNKTDAQYGCWKTGNKNLCNYKNTVINCPFTCGICKITLV